MILVSFFTFFVTLIQSIQNVQYTFIFLIYPWLLYLATADNAVIQGCEGGYISSDYTGQ